jgi:carbonic anhydrase
MDALRSITVAQHLLGVENVVVVHHTHCGATSYTADGIIAAHKHEHGTDISELYPRESVCISDFVSSLEYDTRLIRESAGTPPHVGIYGYVYDVDTGDLTRVTEDVGAVPSRQTAHA